MMNLNLGSCDLLLMFIVLVIVPVFLFLFGGNISVIVYEYV